MLNEVLDKLKPNTILKGNLFPEQVHVIVAQPFGSSIKLIGRGESNLVYDMVIKEDQFNEIEFVQQGSYDGDAQKFRLAIEALRLGLAYEYDPYFSLSIARVDPLPHQLEAVYDYFLKLPRIRFLLADDPGAGKTIMAGLLIKELKARGLVKRILIVTPANLTFQWQRELKDKFRESFEIIRGDILRTNYGSNPWQERNQVLTSVSWVSLQEDANQSLLRATWDLVIVDEAHKMSAYDEEHKTYAYQLGEQLSDRTDHFLLMTATPHRGDKNQFQLFLKLLDKDVYADVASLEEGIEKGSTPFYLRRVKEALQSFPDEQGNCKLLFTKRFVTSSTFELNDDEMEFYLDLTRYVEDQSIKAASTNSPAARALGFTMAMLQRRFASSVYAVRRSLERMRNRREEMLRDPENWRKKQIEKRLPDNFEDLPDEEQQKILEELEDVVIDFNPIDLKEEIVELSRLVDKAKHLEYIEIETKVVKLKEVITKQGVFDNPQMKLLIFTEHKDTLDYLVGDGKDERPLGKLIEWGLSITQIHGGMKIGDRNTPGSRIYAEREFKETAQVLVATEAAGEGINLQFCWLMINYDIPWNPARLEQRMGRIHRYGQEKDCLIINFISMRTREGRVMHKLFEKLGQIELDIDPNRTGKVFNVLGDIFPANELEKEIKKMYTRNYESESPILDRIVKMVDKEYFIKITNSTLEGLAKKELNLSAIVGKSAEAKERRLVPEVIQDFFIQSAPYQGIHPKEKIKNSGIYNIGRIPRNLWKRGEDNEKRFGVMGREYGFIVFSKEALNKDNTLDWLTPGHPLFEVIREETIQQFQEDLKKGTIYYDINISEPLKLDVFATSIVDGLNNVLHRRLFVLETMKDGTIAVKQPTIFLDIIPVLEKVKFPDASQMRSRIDLEQYLVHSALNNYLEEVRQERQKETNTIERHLDISLNELIQKQNIKLSEYIVSQQNGDTNPSLASNISQTENRILELTNRLENRKSDLAKEKQCSIANVQHLGTAWLLPHPDRNQPELRAMVSDAEIEKIAIRKAIEHEESLGYEVQTVESENRGFDLISRKPHPEDPKTAIDVKFIEVKGRAFIDSVALTSNEYKTAQRLKQDYYLYVVYNCASTCELHIIKDPAVLGWKPIVKVEHYIVKATEIINAAK